MFHRKAVSAAQDAQKEFLVKPKPKLIPLKQNKFSPGVHIPIKPYESFQKKPPDYAFLFAWNHQDEIFEKEHKYRKLGGKWITHVPEVKIF